MKKKTRKNPRRFERWAIYAKSGAVRTHYTGSKFTHKGKAKKFASQTGAYSVAMDLVNKFPALRQTRLTVEKLRSPKFEARGIRKNPSGYRRAVDAFARELDEADERLNAFAGRSARETLSVDSPDIRAGLVIGKLEGVMYRADRGDGEHNYFHRFSKKSRPLLISKHDGTQLGIVGGQLRFTEKGIEDV
jgi:hypothetical protein